MSTPEGGFYLETPVYLKDGTMIYRKEGAFDSSETKPTGASAKLASGSSIIEPNTGEVYIYNRKTDHWDKQ